MGFVLSSSGSFNNIERFFKRAASGEFYRSLDRHGRAGVSALQRATPKETGESAAGWAYRIRRSPTSAEIEWYNTHAPYGEVVVLLIQYGHGTGTGGYVRGIDYINPAMRTIFEEAISQIVKEVNG